MPIFNDEEFGKIVVRRSKFGSQVRVRVSPDGSLRASLPPYAPLFLVKRLLASNRQEIRRLIDESSPVGNYYHGMQVGKSHILMVEQTALEITTVNKKDRIIYVNLSTNDNISDPHVVRLLRSEMIAALRLEAKSYLPKRLDYLANKHGFRYTKIRFSHSGGRWGSCNTNGTISLNIALMKLPLELIDYVIIHELSHTVQMNHSPEFWSEVAKIDPNYKENRKVLKQHSPSI